MAKLAVTEGRGGPTRRWAARALFFSALPCLVFSVSCASFNPDLKREVKMPESVSETKHDSPAPSTVPPIPDYVTVTEDVSPLKTRVVDLSARNTPLGDVLHVIAEAASLNLVMESGVNPNMPITLTLKNISVEDALSVIFSSADYFYKVKDNMLTVKAVDTKVFELGYPSVLQNYNVSVGGDITGSGSAGGSSGGTSGSASTVSSNLRGSLTQTVTSDASAYNLWDSIDKGLANILGTTAASAPAATSGQQAAAGMRQTYVINKLTGTIIVTASKTGLEQVSRFLDTIKKIINRQVFIEAKIIEVQLTDGFQFGINWNFLNNWNSGRNTGGFSASSSTFSPAGSPFTAQISNKFNVGLTSLDITTLLNALQTQGEVRTLSNPRLSIMNGQTAILNVGTTINFVSLELSTATTTTGTTVIQTPTMTPVLKNLISGLIIGIVPYINESGEISLTITPLTSELLSFDQLIIPNSGASPVTIAVPKLNIRELSTTIKVRDGQTVIIGGLISKKENLDDNKLPGLGEVPAAGWLFKNRSRSESKTEMVIVLQANIVSR